MFAEDAVEREQLREDPRRCLEGAVHEDDGRLAQHLQIGISRQYQYRVVLVDDEVVTGGSFRPLPGQGDVSDSSRHGGHVASSRAEHLRSTPNEVRSGALFNCGSSDDTLVHLYKP